MPSEAQIEKAARSDAQFDGRTFDGLSAADKRRYRDRARAALAAAEVKPEGWQPIETAPEGTPRKPGAVSYCWMMLAVPDDEGGYHRLSGIRCNDEFFAAGTFYRGGPWNTRQLRLKECQVHPTHWMPLPAPPVLSALEGE